jgi:hypothetical protein
VNARLVSAAALLALLPALAAADQVYKWTDQQGHVHYSSTPPASTQVQAQHMNVAVPPPDPQSLQNSQQLQKELADKDKAAKDAAEKDKPDPKTEALKQQHCDELRMRLQTLTQSGRAATTDAAGNVNYLDDAGRQSQVDEINKELTSDCKGH